MEIQNQKILSNGPKILLDYVNQCTNSVRLLHELTYFNRWQSTSLSSFSWNQAL